MLQTYMCKWCGTRYCRECGHGDFIGMMKITDDDPKCRVCFQVCLRCAGPQPALELGEFFYTQKGFFLALCPSLRGTSPIYGKIRKNQVLLGGGAWAPPLATGLEVCCCELRSRTQSCLFNCIARHLPKQHVHSIAKKCFSLDAKAKGSSFTFEKIHLPTVGGAHRRNEAKVQNQSAAKASRKVRRNARSDESHFTRLHC